MPFPHILHKTNLLKNKLKRFWVHKKKLRALENFCFLGMFRHHKYLELVRGCMEEGFLQEKEEEFLDYMLTKYELNYLDWAHRTRWLNKEMVRVSKEREIKKIQQLQLQLPKMTYDVPVHLLNNKNLQSRMYK